MTPENRSLDEWHRGVPLSAKWPTIVGIGILVVWGACFGAWAGLAPLTGAVVARGSFVATGQNKLIQHFEGGIVAKLLGREGDLVDAGQTLVRMDETLAQARLRRLVLKKYRLVAMQARLESEMNGRDELEMPQALAANAGDPEVTAILARQHSELQARRASLAAEELVLQKEIAGIEESIQGYEAQMESTKRRIAIFGEELRDKNKLFNNHLTRKTEVLALQRAEASLVGDQGELIGRIADSKQRIARAKQRIVHLRSLAVKAAVQELREVEAELDDVLEQIHAAEDVVNRTDVRAPTRGIIVKLNYHTPGAVVAPGAVIMELLPVQDELIIEAQIKPSDVTHVSIGQQALVRLSALNRRVTPTVLGNVTYLSADALSEQPASIRNGSEAGRDYYVVRVELNETDVLQRMKDFRPTPGMPVDVYIKTGDRTFFEYIMRPVLDSFSHAFREI